MSEEKPHFKVTDRRLFNPDGTPRDIERKADTTTDDNAPAATGTETVAAAGADSAAVASTPAAETARRERSSSPPPAETASESRPATAMHDAPDAAATGAAEEAEDPTAFANLVMFIASPAAAAMGMTEHPGLAPGELDLPLAKHCIDLLGTIQQKTHGNLSTQEGQILEGLLAELRMQYISLTSTQRPPARPRGFTGNDITGGR
ncbi:MAG: DUF1844 domain-containing protein [Acidobacteria bacterium]|nr:DUF1844 domain-containing protein [Acidobacteriota bacterium]